MDKSVKIAQVNELNFYLNWDYVKDVCNEAVRKENEQLRKFLEEFNALEVVKENQQLKEKLEKAEATLLDIDGGWVTDEIRSKISEYFVHAIGEKK